MQLIKGFEGLAPGQRGASVALGNFDGVHRGHQALIAEAARAGARIGAPTGVITFEPHPRRFFQPDAPPFRLTPSREKARILAKHGVGHIHELAFDATLAAMPAEAFVEQILAGGDRGGLGIRHLVIGEDFRFGKGRTGDARLLRNMSADLGFTVSIHHILKGEAGEYSSTAVRVHLEEGRCDAAAAQLGRWHGVSGPVIKGDQRGREFGYPTANLTFGEQIIPRYGIYAAQVEVLDGPHAGTHAGVASIGERPTFGINAPNFEVHLFDFDGDLYGAQISAGLVAYLRGEERFDNIEALIVQMGQDASLARARLPMHLSPAGSPVDWGGSGIARAA
ncbi:MAG TPA: bifunctional riboflavin kinase/FAD synthetase [Thermohalobaculum sp.]|nr:bifunctional riboflavin kinase/FAD synthetase [Thermohalobaculum sp.]